MTDSDSRHFRAALGFSELGMLEDSFAELDCITPEHRGDPDVLTLRCWIYRNANKWNEAAEVASGLTRVAPDRFDGWWMFSFALHALKRTQEAYDNLASVLPRFNGEWMAFYNLGCYLVQLGRIDEARPLLEKAFQLKPEARLAALNDADLEPIWTELQSKK